MDGIAVEQLIEINIFGISSVILSLFYYHIKTAMNFTSYGDNFRHCIEIG